MENTKSNAAIPQVRERFEDPWPGQNQTEVLGTTPAFVEIQDKNNQVWHIWFRKSRDITEHIGQALELRRAESNK